jgi:hypothetical protein
MWLRQASDRSRMKFSSRPTVAVISSVGSSSR